MRKKILFIFNPRSGKGQTKNKLYDIIDVFVKAGYEVIVHPTQGARDAVKMSYEMAEEVDMIVCAGGDGTLDEVVTGIMKSGIRVPFGYIPAGSTNDFASSLGISKDMVKAAKDIVEGRIFPFDVGDFNQGTFVYIAAFGLFTDVSYQTDQTMKNTLGHLAYLMEGTKRIFDVKSYFMSVEANGQIYEGNYLYGMITNSNSVGGFRNLVGDGVVINDGLFEVTLIKQPKTPLELSEIVTALMTSFDNTNLIDSFKTDRIVLRALEEVSWTLDGEYGGNHKEVVIENKKQAMDIIINS